MKKLIFFAVLSASTISYSQQTDPDFKPVVVKASGMEHLVVQPDGKLLVVHCGISGLKSEF